MVAVKTGLAPPPMMPNQPMNMMPPPMPVPALNQPMPMQQGAAPVPVNARRRKRFGDSLETMLSRPSMVASDQMGDMNVFTGQMMNTAARPPVVGMRGGGIVRNMRRGGYSMADYSSPSFTSYTDSKKNTFAPTAGTPGRAVKTHQEIMDSIRGSSSPGDDKPAPVVVVNTPPPDITGSFSDPSSREDYTPTAAELNQQLLDMGAPDKRFDVVPGGVDKIYGGMGDLDAADNYREELANLSAETAFDSQYPGSSTILPPKTGGIAAIRSGQPIPDELSLDIPFDNTPSVPSMSFGQQPAGSLPADPNIYISDVFESSPSMQFGDQPAGALPMDPDFYDPRDDRSGFVDPLEPFGGAGEIINLGIGDPEIVRPKVRPEGGGQGGTGSGEEEDDRGFVEKFKDDARKFGSSFVKDLQMGIAAGLFGSRATRYQRLIDAGYSAAEANDFLDRSEDTMKKMMDKQAQQSAQDDDSPMSTSVVDPCPPGFKLDPVSGICVPIEEAEEEGPSLSLNRTRDDEFNELDDIMKRIVKPIEETDNVRTMQAGGSVGLNRVADNFLAAMGG